MDSFVSFSGRRADWNTEQYNAQPASALRCCLTADCIPLGRQSVADGFYQSSLVGLWPSLAGRFDVGTLYADGDNLAATQGSQGTAGQSIWGPFHLAHRRIAPWFGRWWYPAGVCPCNQRDCFLSARLYPGRSEWTCITNLPRFVSSLCRLWLLGQGGYG